MPSSSTLSTGEKTLVKSVIPYPTKILAASLARIYFAYPDPRSWSFGGLQGAFMLIADRTRGAHFLSFAGDVRARKSFYSTLIPLTSIVQECMIGIVFPAEGDAKNFYKQVSNRKEIKRTSCVSAYRQWLTVAAKAKADSGTPKKSVAKGGTIDKSRISAPKAGSFVHVAHMGFDAEKGFTSTGVDPSWIAFLGDLQSHGIDEAVIAENMDFIKSFVRGAQKDDDATNGGPKKKGPPPRIAPRRGGHAQQDSTSSIATPPPA